MFIYIIYIINGCLCAIAEELSSCNRDFFFFFGQESLKWILYECNGLNVSSPSSLCIKIIASQMMVLGGGASDSN